MNMKVKQNIKNETNMKFFNNKKKILITIFKSHAKMGIIKDCEVHVN